MAAVFCGYALQYESGTRVGRPHRVQLRRWEPSFGLSQVRSLLHFELYYLYCSPVCAPGQLPVKTTEFGVEFPASLTAVFYGGVSPNAVKYFEPGITEFMAVFPFRNAGRYYTAIAQS